MISRRAYYGGRPSGSKGTKSKSAKSPKAKSTVVLSRIIDNLCTGELNQSGEYQAVWTAVMKDNDDSDLGRLSRMSYAELEEKYGMRHADRYTGVEVDAKRFKEECRKAAAKAKSKSKSK